MHRRWKQPVTTQTLTDIQIGTAVERLGIDFLELGDDRVSARVPVELAPQGAGRIKAPNGELSSPVLDLSVVFAFDVPGRP